MLPCAAPQEREDDGQSNASDSTQGEASIFFKRLNRCVAGTLACKSVQTVVAVSSFGSRPFKFLHIGVIGPFKQPELY